MARETRRTDELDAGVLANVEWAVGHALLISAIQTSGVPGFLAALAETGFVVRPAEAGWSGRTGDRMHEGQEDAR